ncbi:hypothetical protein Ddye_011106 [Dipteronia dyeriana]|uniref:Terpene synthase N-terminal domain-containing protein n=1 Tax=Dipteronia dyeriana TaxID=168575 RepID=A0AAD9XEN5_9ROSI|nr:hypothetical protein Ddye_011106 [Dipteronia dyeriana]
MAAWATARGSPLTVPPLVGVFNRFKEDHGKFKKTLTSDARGILSLYEATHLRVHGEDILEEALAFSKAHLKSLAGKSSPHLARQILKSIQQPLHNDIPRLEAIHYISIYEENESRNESLLLFAKLDFNRVQLLHQQEIDQVRRGQSFAAHAVSTVVVSSTIVILIFIIAATSPLFLPALVPPRTVRGLKNSDATTSVTPHMNTRPQPRISKQNKVSNRFILSYPDGGLAPITSLPSEVLLTKGPLSPR